MRHARRVPLFRRKPADDQPVDMEARSPQLGLKYKDLAVMAALGKSGGDLSQPRHVVYYCYATSADAGRIIAEAAQAQGFTAAVREPLPKDPGRWAVIAETNAVLSPDFVRGNTDFFEALAELHDAEYDGWEAAV